MLLIILVKALFKLVMDHPCLSYTLDLPYSLFLLFIFYYIIFFVPSFAKNLIYVSQFCSDDKVYIKFFAYSFSVMACHMRKLLLRDLLLTIIPITHRSFLFTINHKLSSSLVNLKQKLSSNFALKSNSFSWIGEESFSHLQNT